MDIRLPILFVSNVRSLLSPSSRGEITLSYQRASADLAMFNMSNSIVSDCWQYYNITSCRINYLAMNVVPRD